MMFKFFGVLFQFLLIGLAVFSQPIVSSEHLDLISGEWEGRLLTYADSTTTSQSIETPCSLKANLKNGKGQWVVTVLESGKKPSRIKAAIKIDRDRQRFQLGDTWKIVSFTESVQNNDWEVLLETLEEKNSMGHLRKQLIAHQDSLIVKDFVQTGQGKPYILSKKYTYRRVVD